MKPTSPVKNDHQVKENAANQKCSGDCPFDPLVRSKTGFTLWYPSKSMCLDQISPHKVRNRPSGIVHGPQWAPSGDPYMWKTTPFCGESSANGVFLSKAMLDTKAVEPFRSQVGLATTLDSRRCLTARLVNCPANFQKWLYAACILVGKKNSWETIER